MIKGSTPTHRELRSTKYPFAIRRSPIAGRGAIATRRIRKGQRIIEYVGEIISQKESDRRYPDGENRGNHHTFLFEIDDKKVIDASYDGNEARFINHACQPNCEAIDEEERIFIFARKNVQPGVELTYDYNYPRERGDGPDEAAQYPCRCGSKRCRGSIMEAPKRKRKKKNSRPRKTRTQARKLARKKRGEVAKRRGRG